MDTKDMTVVEYEECRKWRQSLEGIIFNEVNKRILEFETNLFIGIHGRNNVKTDDGT